jgi:F0F1-type ATP synthase epsilon subunit
MKLGIYSLQRVLFDGEAREVNCMTTSGEISVLDHHEPLISLLGKGVIKVVDAEHKDHFIPARSGFLEIDANNQAKLLIEEDLP